MRPLRFRVVALIAAYGLALHGLLLAFGIVASTTAGAHIAGLCSALNSGQNNLPVDPDAACDMACAVLGSALAAPAPPVTSVSTPAVVAVLSFAGSQTPLPPVPKGPQRARAPPPV